MTRSIRRYDNLRPILSVNRLIWPLWYSNRMVTVEMQMML